MIFSGGCRCGGVTYRSYAHPSSITFCHCRACQQLSGSAYIPFIEVPKTSTIFISRSTLQKLRLTEKAERTFCRNCGTPITMEYFVNREPRDFYLTMGSVEMNTFKSNVPKVSQHIYVKEKAAWDILPEDGAPRYQVLPTRD